MLQRPKDPCILFRNVIRAKNKKIDQLNPQGGDRISLYLDPEQTMTLVSVLTENQANPRGVKIDLHISKKVNQQRGNVFDSAFAFVKAVEEAQQTAQPRYVPKGTPSMDTHERTKTIFNELD